jgi:cyclic pyranopterin phosphate synthase
MPEEGVTPCLHENIMRYEDIAWLSEILASLGVNRVRFTGGEPFARRGMPEFLVAFKGEFPGMAVSVTTNASLLPLYAETLSRAGLSGMNISLDTVDSAKFAEITRSGNINDVMAGIDAALSLGIREIKTNTVLIRDFNDKELPDILNFTWKKKIIPRIIEFMPLQGNLWGPGKFVGSSEIFDILRRYGDWVPIQRGKNSSRGPAKYFADSATGRVVGIIEAVSNHFCSDCNRLRITASGHMRACLFNNDEVPLLHLIRERDADAVRNAVTSGINLKPENWRASADGEGHMSSIGG